MRALALLCALALGACAPEADPEPAATASGLADASASAPEAEEGCIDAAPYRVCRVETSGEAEIVVTREGAETARWPAASGAQAGPFAAHAQDLDRDGESDLLVATQTAVSNGMGVATWTIGVLPDGETAPAYAFEARDFASFETHLDASGDGVVFWATDWISAPDPDGKRDEGMYLAGRPFVLASGGLTPARDFPLRARRFLESFDRNPDDGPAGWFAAPEAETFATDPALAGCVPTDSRITVQSARDSVDTYGGTFRALTLADGREATYLQGSPGDQDIHIDLLGDAASGRLFPAEYTLPGLNERLRGGTFRLTACASGEWIKTRVLWL